MSWDKHGSRGSNQSCSKYSLRKHSMLYNWKSDHSLSLSSTYGLHTTVCFKHTIGNAVAPQTNITAMMSQATRYSDTCGQDWNLLITWFIGLCLYTAILRNQQTDTVFTPSWGWRAVIKDGFYLNSYTQSNTGHRYSPCHGNLFFLWLCIIVWYFNIELKKWIVFTLTYLIVSW